MSDLSRVLGKKVGDFNKKESTSLDFTGLKIPRDYHQKKEGFTKNEEKKLDVPTEQQIHECDGSTGTYGDNHGNEPFLHVVSGTGQDARRFQKTQKVLNHDEMAQPPYG